MGTSQQRQLQQQVVAVPLLECRDIAAIPGVRLVVAEKCKMPTAPFHGWLCMASLNSNSKKVFEKGRDDRLAGENFKMALQTTLPNAVIENVFVAVK